MLTVKFVDNETFDSLPYKNAGTSLGVADRTRGVAYVRDTGNPMDIFTAYHELEHLKGEDWEEHASPNEDGVYYKGFGQMFDSIGGTLAPILGGFLGGPIGSAAASGMQNFAGGIVNKSGRKDAANKLQEQQQPSMQQFNPATSMTGQQSQMAAAPATSSVGGNGGNFAGGEMGGTSTADRIRSLMRDRQSGFLQGRDAGRLM